MLNPFMDGFQFKLFRILLLCGLLHCKRVKEKYQHSGRNFKEVSFQWHTSVSAACSATGIIYSTGLTFTYTPEPGPRQHYPCVEDILRPQANPHSPHPDEVQQQQLTAQQTTASNHYMHLQWTGRHSHQRGLWERFLRGTEVQGRTSDVLIHKDNNVYPKADKGRLLHEDRRLRPGQILASRFICPRFPVETPKDRRRFGGVVRSAFSVKWLLLVGWYWMCTNHEYYWRFEWNEMTGNGSRKKAVLEFVWDRDEVLVNLVDQTLLLK